MTKYPVLVGGTFDIFHKGHKLLIEKSLSEGNSVIAITSDELANKTRERNVNSFSKRRKRVAKFAKEIANEHNTKYTITEIDDPEGPAYTGEDYQKIIVSPESKTIERVNRINDIRISNGLNKLDIKVVETFYAEDGNRISSTRIRNGIIDRKGNLIEKNDELAIISDIHYGHSEKTKETIKEAIQEVLDEVYGRKIVVVGDIIHETDHKTDIENMEEITSLIKDHSKQEVYFVPGNHDVHNITQAEFENIIDHTIPQTISLKSNTRLHLIDSAFHSKYDNVGYISSKSIELVAENTQTDGQDIVISHFPVEYTDLYQKSEYFDEYPEGVFPVNKFEYNQQVNTTEINTNIFAHLHLRDEITYITDERETIINSPITKNPINPDNPEINCNYRIIDF